MTDRASPFIFGLLALVVSPVLLASPAARADGPAVDPAPPANPERFPPHSLPWREWPVLDPFLSIRDKRVDLALVREQTVGGGPGQGGFVIGFGQGIETLRHALLLRLERDFQLRVTGGDHAVASLLQYGGVAGVSLGPVEIFGGCAVSLAQVHFGGGGFGLGFLSPRAEVGAALDVWKLRVGVRAYDEYAWRWINGPSAFVRGVILEIGLTSPPELPEKYRLVK